MSQTFSGWILKTVDLLGKRSYSQASGNQARWRRARPGPDAPRARLAPSARRGYRSTAEDVSYHLSPGRVDELLRANEQSCGGALSFESNVLASNSPCEDRRGSATCLQTRGHLFGVFDGHAGPACARSVSERLFYYVAVSMMPQAALEELEAALEGLRPVPPVLQWHKHRNDYEYREIDSLYVDHLRVFWQELIELDNEAGMSPAEAMGRAFRRLDSDISLEAQAAHSDGHRALQIAFSGATACVSHVDGPRLTVANAGDCRAVLGVEEEDGSWSARPLTADHNAFNPAELRRVRSEHPESEGEMVVSDQRLLGLLMPFRAFGDVRFKWSEELQKSVLQNYAEPDIYQYHPAHYLTPPYLTAAPEVVCHRLGPRDRFLVMASDGLWDVLGNEEVVGLVGGHLAESRLRGPQVFEGRRRSLGTMQDLLLQRRGRKVGARDRNVATHLIRHAVGANEDGEVEPERLAAMLSMPEDLCRMYRDDITVTVVFFNSAEEQPGR